MRYIIEDIEPIVLENKEKKETIEGVKVSFSSVMTWEEFSELKKNTNSWSVEDDGRD